MKNIFSKIGLAALLTALVIWSPSPALAATISGGFKQIDMEDGGWLPVIVRHPSGRLYGRTDGGGVYRSDNNGDSWTFLGGDFTSNGALIPQGIAVRQSVGSDSNVVLQATGAGDYPTDAGRGIWKSADGGNTWTQRLTGVNFSGGDAERVGGDCLIFNPAIDTEAWAGSRKQGVWKSIDSGDTWWEVGGATFTNTIFASICINAAYPDQVFAGGGGGLWMSLNRGTNWTKLKTFDLVYRITRKPNGTVFVGGTLNGTSMIQKITASDWANTNTYTFTDLRPAYVSGISANNNAIMCLTVLQDGRLIAGDNDGYTRISTNDGASFKSLPQTPVPGIPVPLWASPTTVWRPTSLVQDLAQTNRWFGGGGYGPMRTDDGGQTWRYICNGIGQVVTYKVGFHATDSNRVYIPCADHGAAVVTDGGASGKVAGMATQSFPWPDDIVMFSHRALAAKVNGTNRAIFPGGGQINAMGGRLYVTLNDGATWFKAAAAGLPTAGAQQIVEGVDSLDNPDDILVVCGGVTGAGAGGVYRSTNGCASFTQCSGIPNGLDLGGTFYFNATLERDATNTAVRYLFLRQYPPTTGGGFFRSTDRGVTWTRVWAPDNNWYGTFVADHRRTSNLWFAVSGDTKGLARSTNAGVTWTYDTSFKTVNAVDALDGRICVFGQRTNDPYYKIYYSTNDGAAWDEITRPGYRFPNVFSVACDPYRSGRVWISTGQRSVAIFTPGTPIEQWRSQNFLNPANQGIGADAADPDGDGLNNITEYSLGSNPRIADGTNLLPRAIAPTDPVLDGHLTLRLNLPEPPPNDIVVRAQVSSNLTGWNTIATRIGTNSWQWNAPPPPRVLSGSPTNSRALFDIGHPELMSANANGYMRSQIQLSP